MDYLMNLILPVPGAVLDFAHSYRTLVFAEQLAIVAVVTQILGYIMYINKIVRHHVNPNPSTWLMFAYGTSLLTVLEFDTGAHVSLLLLPISCAVLSVWVAYDCWKRGKIGWPEDWEDRASFIADLVLTACYIGAWALLMYGGITESLRAQATWWFLICSNATTVTAFIPLLRSAYREPDTEHAPSWFVWTIAYSTLAIATGLSEGWTSVFMVYPLSNAVLHATVAVLARSSRHNRRRRIAA